MAAALISLAAISNNSKKVKTMKTTEFTKGKMEVYDLSTFRMHVYYTNDALGDASYIFEGNSGLITLEQPLFKDNVSEFDSYVSALGKAVVKRISNYHVGGTGHHTVAMPEGMPDFVEGDIYGGMMQNFSHIFGDAIVSMPTGEKEEIAFGDNRTWDGIEFAFRKGASTDFPAASIVIGGKVYYTHWTPAKAHVSHLQVSSLPAIDAEIKEAENALKSGCEIFIGGHGGAAQKDAVAFKIAYLKNMKRIARESKTTDAFVQAMREAYPNLPGEEGLGELAKALLK